MYIIIITVLTGRSSLIVSLTLCPYYPSFLAVPTNYIQCLHRANVNLCWLVITGTSMNRSPIGECHLWVHPYFSNSGLHVLFILLEWFVRWDVSGHTADILLGVASRIYSKQHITFLFNSHLTFSSNILSAFMWCTHAEYRHSLCLEEIPFLFCLGHQISNWSITCIPHVC